MIKLISVLLSVCLISCAGAYPKQLYSVYCNDNGDSSVAIDKPVEAYIKVYKQDRILYVNLSPTSHMIRFLNQGEECVFVSPNDAALRRDTSRGKPRNGFNNNNPQEEVHSTDKFRPR